MESTTVDTDTLYLFVVVVVGAQGGDIPATGRCELCRKGGGGDDQDVESSHQRESCTFDYRSRGRNE